MKSETELLAAVKSGNEDAFQSIILLYEPLLKATVSELLQDGLFTKNDAEDLHQEAVIALYQAVTSYDQSQTAVTFGLYAKICVRNRLLSVRRKRQRSEAVGDVRAAGAAVRETSSDKRTGSDEPAGSGESVGAYQTTDTDKQAGLRRQTGARTVSEKVLKSAEKMLSEFEVSVYRLYLCDYTVSEIAVRLGRSQKSVENALYRVRRKFSEIAKEDS